MDSLNIVKEYVRGWIRHDSNKVLQYFETDGVYIDPLLDREIRGKEIAKHAEKYFTAFPDLSFEGTGQITQSEGLWATQWIMRGTGSAELKIEIPGADFLVVQNGRIKSVQAYFDHRKIPDNIRSFFSEPGTPPQKKEKAQNIKESKIPEKYKKSALPAIKAKQIKHEIEGLMREKNLHRENELSLSRLAVLLGYSNNHVSQVINSEFGMNFYDFVNRYRVSDAKKMLLDRKPSDMSILDVALEVGFNSKSTFNAAFKKQTSLTPSQFIQSLVD